MKKQTLASPAFLLATVIIAIGFAFGPSLISAQEAATPSTIGGQDHPAHIHNGTCDDLGDIVYPLDNVQDATSMATQEASTPVGAEPGQSSDVDLAISITTVDVSLDDLLAEDYAINVHLSPEEASVFIACGDISGSVEDNSLDVTLNEVDDSGYSGDAELTDNGDGTTTVFVTVKKGATPATPVASPMS